ncbi:hypothetical protein [Roseovarius sp. MMSF_3281]|uniref:hypothetical protein n=1 Tax=Roseovarius sp. MMSF_3281 TaxID=3046694 RepID=UPI00273E52A0|nr:hypothetical protein [Roseovarius sp. MMSF_3281]
MSGGPWHSGPGVVVHVHGSYPEHGTGRGGDAPRDVCGPSPGPLAGFPREAHQSALSRGSVPQAALPGARPVADPHEVQRAMPELWQSFIRANFSDLRAVMMAFGVSERAARKWWNAEGGVNGAYVVHAFRRWPDAARAWLEAA